eukprot:CAMPEP_0179307074 /NCGR_PEP_ID=MMETSP0797-20121207/50458_1 /TAXON_ID=47934 /ORGANISM="Dinophysis acuminata, Strain DAEP01" /LENGTH=182 /DNA_ID=CAMNT_0021016755 /DNA_START=9 /DNA_END=554 /DNA_ORIENTATION=+
MPRVTNSNLAVKKQEKNRYAVLPRGAFLDMETEDSLAESKTRARLYLGHIPRGTSEETIQAECLKYGAVASILYNSDPNKDVEEPWALVSFKDPGKVATAVSRLNRRLGFFGSTQPVECRVSTPGDVKRMEDFLKIAVAPQDGAGDSKGGDKQPPPAAEPSLLDAHGKPAQQQEQQQQQQQE